MADESETTCYIQYLPTEILLKIFISLPVKDLTTCRAVSTRWNLIIDGLARSDDLWAGYCKKDFSRVCAVARKKAKPGLIWYNLYRSLTLWQKIAASREEVDEFCSLSHIEEIKGFQILNNGVVGVHKIHSIVYYNTDTLQKLKRRPISGIHVSYAENDKALVRVDFCSHCFLELKDSKLGAASHVTFDGVEQFLLTDKALYFVKMDRNNKKKEEIYVCSFSDEKLQAVFLKNADKRVMALGFSDGHLNILTFQREIITVVGKDLVYKCILGPDSNILHQMRKYNFLEQINCGYYHHWKYVLSNVIPSDQFRHINLIRSYGDVYFVGSHSGELRIYYAPYSGSEFDIFKAKPVKQYNFMEKPDCPECPVLSKCPILQVDAFEVEDGHTVLVAMPKKIAVLKLTHSFKRTASIAMLPYSDVQKVKFMKMTT